MVKVTRCQCTRSSSCFRSWGGHWHSSWLPWLATWEAPWRPGLLGYGPLAFLNSIELRPSLSFCARIYKSCGWYCFSCGLLPHSYHSADQPVVHLVSSCLAFETSCQTSVGTPFCICFGGSLFCPVLNSWWVHLSPSMHGSNAEISKVQVFCMHFSSFSWPLPAATLQMLVELKWIKSSASLSERVKKFPCVIGPLWLTLAFISALGSWRTTVLAFTEQQVRWNGPMWFCLTCESGWKTYKWNHLTNFDIESMEIELRRDKVSWGQGKGSSFHLFYL